MTLAELKDILISRVGWEQPSGSGLTVTAGNQTSDSGRYYQEGHSAVTLENIHKTIPVVDADDTVFNEYLAKFSERTVNQVVADVFNRSTVKETVIDEVTVFDNAIIIE
jgi:molybdopterin-guanine dinucleotide biosynthesis protein